MGKMLIKQGWVLALLIHGILAVLILHSTMLAFGFTTQHLADHCTEYCEYYGCTHGNRFARFYPLVTKQVAGLYRLAGFYPGGPTNDDGIGYQYANILVYCVLGGLFSFVSLSYLLSRQKTRTTPPLRWQWWLTGLLVPTLIIWLQPGGVSLVYGGCVDLCLLIGYVTGYTLYEVYTIGFVFVLPGILLVLLVLTGSKWLIIRMSRVSQLELTNAPDEGR